MGRDLKLYLFKMQVNYKYSLSFIILKYLQQTKNGFAKCKPMKKRKEKNKKQTLLCFSK